MIHMSESQGRLWAYIRCCEHPPSMDEMTYAMGWSAKSYTFKVLDALERKGCIRCIRKGGYRVHRGISANEGPRPDLAGYTTGELSDEVRRRENTQERLAA